MGTKVLPSHRFFYELQSPINIDKTWNLSKMCFLHVKVAKRDTQRTEVKALWCWSDKNETKTRLQLCPPFSIISTSFQRHIIAVLLEIVVLANSKKNRNIKPNDVNLISVARSTDFCFKTTYVGMFLCFRSIIRCFQCFVRGPSPFGKQFPMNPPYPLEITAFEPPLPLGISNDLPWGGGGEGMDIFWNHTLCWFHERF